MKKKNDRTFFENRTCEYFPCHKVEGDFNCLFCYCPLYTLGEDCGGNFTILNNGLKDCSACTYPHEPENYDCIITKLALIGRKNVC